MSQQIKEGRCYIYSQLCIISIAAVLPIYKQYYYPVTRLVWMLIPQNPIRESMYVATTSLQVGQLEVLVTKGLGSI
jgi:hypothetical protein